mmetsp:Transcript_32631/g.43521  ORF Transcript_32631/g.43521 Transcript_32631/m.43521 type:complete len:96 (-) Transcript_32631:515-802(-)
MNRCIISFSNFLVVKEEDPSVEKESMVRVSYNTKKENALLYGVDKSRSNKCGSNDKEEDKEEEDDGSKSGAMICSNDATRSFSIASSSFITSSSW